MQYPWSLFRTAPIQIGSIVLVSERPCLLGPGTLYSRHKQRGLLTLGQQRL
jgi:hypothetical protein